MCRRQYRHKGCQRRRGLAGNAEQSISEVGPRNAVTIADNVGDCVGMAGNPFESLTVMLVVSLIPGKRAFGN